MKHKLKTSVLLLTGALILAESSFSTGYATPPNKPPEVQVGLEIGKARISGGETTTGRIVVRRNGSTEELILRLENSNPSLVRLSTSEITLKPAESSASFDIFSASTPIRSSVTIKASLLRAAQVQTQKVLEIVPAMLKGVTLSQPTLNGTNGSKITCRVELNANAPTGGIELYLNLHIPSERVKGMLLKNINPRVAAGNREVTFEIAYDNFYSGNRRITFTGQATVELVVSLDPQGSGTWQAIPGVAGKVAFDVIPLRVVSLSIQPTSVTGGAEALATFTLNFPAGNNERVYLGPSQANTSQRAWTRLLGSSCQANPVSNQLEMSLAQGVATYSFKVCTASVTTPTTGTLHAGGSSVQVTVQP